MSAQQPGAREVRVLVVSDGYEYLRSAIVSGELTTGETGGSP